MRALLAVVALLLVAPAAEAYTSALTPDGRVLIHEDFRSDHIDGEGIGGLIGEAMVNADGTIDRGFGRNGFQVAPPGEEIAGDGEQLAYDIAQRLVSAFHHVVRVEGENEYTAYVRVDGEQRLIASPDEDFQVAGLAAVAGGLLVGGDVPDPAKAGQRRLAVMKLDPEGARDEEFGDGGLAIATPTALRAVQRAAASQLRVLDDGRILAGGQEVIARFGADGELDEDFGDDGVITSFYLTSVAVDGVSTYTASSPGPPGGGGIVVERLQEDGTPEPGARAEFPLDHEQYVDDNGDGEPDGGVQVSYAPGDILVQPDGGLVVGANERRDDFTFEFGGGGPCPVTSGIPLTATADVEPGEALAASAPRIEHLVRMDDGTLLATGQRDAVDAGACVFGQALIESSGFLARYGEDGGLLGGTIVTPVRTPPAIEIATGPPTAPGSVTGDAPFTFTVTPGPDDAGDVVLRCAIDAGAWRACGAADTFPEAEDGPRTLHVQAIGINGARSEPREYAWTQNRAAPVTTLTAPQGRVTTRDATLEFSADEPATFSCAVDGGPAAPCASPLQLVGLADGAHEVKVTAADELGAAGPAAVAGWTVDTKPAPDPTPTPSPQPSPTPLARPAVRLGVARPGRVSVVVRAAAGARVEVTGRVLRKGHRAVKVKGKSGVVPSSGRLRLVLKVAKRLHGRVRVRIVTTLGGERRTRTVTRRL